MLPLSLFPLLHAISGAPNLGAYSFDPVNFEEPDWTKPLVDSARPGHPTGVQAVARDTTGRIIGRDTSELFVEGKGVHTRKIQWKFVPDTSRSIHESWKRDGIVDSLLWLTCRKDSCSISMKQWARNTPQGTLFVLGYERRQDLTFARYDSILLRLDDKGRFAYQHVWHATNTGYSIDSVEWRDGAPFLWKRVWRNAGTILEESHFPTWHDTRLIRDSVSRRTTSESGAISDSSYRRECAWDGPRILGCVGLPDSLPLSKAEWNTLGLPVRRITESGRVATWSWDGRGRLTGTRLLGAETDYDSLVYAEDALPIQSRIHACDDASVGTESCVLVKTRTFTYSLPGSAGLVRRIHGSANVRKESGRFVFRGLPETAKILVLKGADGRRLGSTSIVDGRCEAAISRTGGLLLWSAQDSHGHDLASGRLLDF